MCVSFTVTIAVIKHYDQWKFWRKGFIWLMLSNLQSMLNEVKTETQSKAEMLRQELVEKPFSGATYLLPMACLPFFLLEVRTTSPCMAPSSIGWALPQNIQLRMCYQRLANSPILWWNFLVEASSSSCNSDWWI